MDRNRGGRGSGIGAPLTTPPVTRPLKKSAMATRNFPLYLSDPVRYWWRMARGDSFQLQGMDGGVCVGAGQTWTAAADGGSRWIQFEQDTVLSSYAGNLRTGSTKLLGVTHLQGKGLGGISTSLGVTSGLVTVYEFGGDGTVA